jgi:hypothetical protein
MKFEQIFKGDLPKFDVSFGRGKFSKINQLNTSKSALNVNSNVQSKPNTSNTSNVNMKRSLSTSSISQNNINSSRLNNNPQRKSLNTSASAKLSSKIKKKYSKQKTNEDNTNKNVITNNNKNVSSNEENELELFRLAFKEIKMLESQRLMDCKSKVFYFTIH